MADAPIAPGTRVRMTLPAYAGTDIYHALYLPPDWRAGTAYPLVVEYAGNGGYANQYGDVCTGRPEDCRLGFGMTAGIGCVWICLPYVSRDGRTQHVNWWGDVSRTAAYCKAAVANACAEYGGDARAVVVCGFSRGAIACNYIGLHDTQIAGLWRASVCHSHYDGVRRWHYDSSDRASARERLKRLGGRPQFISHEGSVEDVKAYLADVCPEGRFTFAALPYRNHTDGWVLRDIPERRALRKWLDDVLKK